MEETQNKFLVPGAIIIAGALIGWGAVSSDPKIESADDLAIDTEIEQPEDVLTQIQIGLKASDHFLGNPDAELIMIGFSDFNCGYCARFHQTMKQVIAEYGKDGRVAWIFRVFPISGEDGKKKAIATECAAKLGGETKYWEFADKLFESETRISVEQLPAIATELELDETEFSQCLNDDKIAELVQNNYQSGLDAGVLGTPEQPGGTPHMLILAKSGESFPISGAQPYELVKTMIDSILEK